MLDAGTDRDDTQRRLLELPGIGPWTAAYVAMRVLRDPDAFLPTDLGVRHALERLGARRDVRPRATRLAEAWRPYRAYALQHLLGRPVAGSGTVPTDRRSRHERRSACFTTVDSPIGELLLAGDGQALRGL